MMRIDRERMHMLGNLILLLWVGIFAPRNFAQEPKKDAPAPKKDAAKDYEETILKHFKHPTDTASLMAYLKAHSASDDDLLAIPDLIKQLGNDTFAERKQASTKLRALGLPAVMPLYDARSDPDSERGRNSKIAFDALSREFSIVTLPPVIIRLLKKRGPPELLELLLRYLPYTTDPDLEQECTAPLKLDHRKAFLIAYRGVPRSR